VAIKIMNTVDFLDWLVELDISFYKTTKEIDYVPTGKSHFYLKGSQERFTSEDMINIFNNNADNDININWQLAIAEHIQHTKKTR
jgi:hypothetical protein